MHLFFKELANSYTLLSTAYTVNNIFLLLKFLSPQKGPPHFLTKGCYEFDQLRVSLFCLLCLVV